MPGSLLLTATSALRLVAALAIRFVEQSTKLVGHLQIGKAPAIIKSTLLQNCTSMSRLNVSCLVKLNDLAAQCDIQPADTGGKLGDVRILSFVPHRLIVTAIARHV